MRGVRTGTLMSDEFPPRIIQETEMRMIKLALAAAVVAAGLLSLGSFTADAKEKMMKAAPGKCGAMMYYNMKAKKCASKG